MIAAAVLSKLDDRLFGALTPFFNVIPRVTELGARGFSAARSSATRTPPHRVDPGFPYTIGIAQSGEPVGTPFIGIGDAGRGTGRAAAWA